MQSTRASEADERKIARIVTSLDGDHAQSFFHGSVRDGDDAGSKLECRPESSAARRADEELLKPALGGLNVETKRSSEEVFRVKTAQDEIRIRHGQSCAAAAVTNRSGRCACALRSHAQRAARVNPRQGAASRTHRMHVEDRDGHGQPGQRGFTGCSRWAIQQRNVRGGSTHVKTNGALYADSLREPCRGYNTARRSGKDSAHGLLGGTRRGRYPTVRLHDVDASAPTFTVACRQLVHAAFEISQIFAHTRGEIGVDDYRR